MAVHDSSQPRYGPHLKTLVARNLQQNIQPKDTPLSNTPLNTLLTMARKQPQLNFDSLPHSPSHVTFLYPRKTLVALSFACMCHPLNCTINGGQPFDNSTIMVRNPQRHHPLDLCHLTTLAIRPYLHCPLLWSRKACPCP